MTIGRPAGHVAPRGRRRRSRAGPRRPVRRRGRQPRPERDRSRARARIISLEPEVTRIIVALGAGDRLVGIDYFLSYQRPLVPPRLSGRPPGCPSSRTRPRSSPSRRPSGCGPTSSSPRPRNSGTAESIERKLGVPVVALASMGRFADLLGEIRTLGRILGREERGGRSGRLSSRRRLRAAIRAARPAAGETASPRSTSRSGARSSARPSPTIPWRRPAAATSPPDPCPITSVRPGRPSRSRSFSSGTPRSSSIQGNYPPAERRVTVEAVLRDPRLASLRAVRSRGASITPSATGTGGTRPSSSSRRSTWPGSSIPEDGPASTWPRKAMPFSRNSTASRGPSRALCRILACHEWIPR
ncbi:MAG: hypothetical protein M0C28_39405 [Candidatus Moduliflexus flocculans]|nr:hypothetical protein [Candidatus Moduliflexus flocculans]